MACQAHTAHSAKKFDLSPDKINGVFEYHTSELFTAPEKAALQVAIHAGMTPNAVEADHMETLSEHYSPKQVVEIVAVISLFGFLNHWNDTMATTLESSPKDFAADHLSNQGWVAGKHG